MDREAEIAQLRHELDILQTRLATYERWGRVVRKFFMIWLPLFLALLVFALIRAVGSDPFLGGFFVALTATLIGVAIWLSVNWRRTSHANGRSFWTDLVAPAPFARSFAPGIPPFFGRRARSDAAIIEDQIAEREQRLAELDAPQ